MKTNSATGIDLKTGCVVKTDVAKRLRVGEKVKLRARWTGGKNWFPMPFNSNAGMLYLSMLEDAASTS